MRVTTLDERTGTLLERLETLCAGGGYHIFEEADLVPYFSAEEVGETLSYLADCRCVDVRYAENGTYCIRLLPAGRAYASHARERAREGRLRLKRTALFAFFGSFAGGFLGALLVAFVFLVGG